MISTLRYLSLMAFLLLFISCSEDDPTEPHQEHFEASGMVLIKSGERFFKIFQGEIVSETKVLEVPLSGLTDHYVIKFLDDDGNEFDPPTDSDKSLDWEITNPEIVEVYRHNETDWDFHLRGLQEGTTEIEFRVLHIDHFGFRTPKIPVEVKDIEDSHGAPEGYRLYEESTGNLIAEYDEHEGVNGTIELKVGTKTEHIEVIFFDHDGNTFQPEVPPHSLRIEIGDENVVEVTDQEEDEPWAFKLNPLKTGSTSLKLTIMHDGKEGIVFDGLIPINVNE